KRLACSQMEKSEKRLFRPQQITFLIERFLDLDYQFSLFEYDCSIRRNTGTRPAIVIIMHPDSGACCCFHYDFMPVSDQFSNCTDCQANTIFMRLDFPGYTDFHEISSIDGWVCRHYN